MNYSGHLIILTISGILTYSILICDGKKLNDVLNQDLNWFENTDWSGNGDAIPRSLQVINVLQKRDCRGFPCMFTHIGGNVGNASIKKARLMLLRECVADPSCFSIGKRLTKRSDFLS